MLNTQNGCLKISDQFIIFPGFTFEQFQNTELYKNQDGIKIIELDEQQIIDNRPYIVSLFFKDKKIYMVSLVCCDKIFSENDEIKRKEYHDNILKKLGFPTRSEYSWGKLSSDYDAKGNVSSINITYF